MNLQSLLTFFALAKIATGWFGWLVKKENNSHTIRTYWFGWLVKKKNPT
jgi:hypothetical protein